MKTHKATKFVGSPSCVTTDGKCLAKLVGKNVQRFFLKKYINQKTDEKTL